MSEICCCPPEAGSAVCELPTQAGQRLRRPTSTCPECGQAGKPVQLQTVKALLRVSLRELESGDYLFCRTPTCPVVYFSSANTQVFTTPQIRERVYQKEPDQDAVFVCYCFRHTVGEVRSLSPQAQEELIQDIHAGIQAGQCACELRNPQGSCCLGNVRELIKRLR
jgi:hypothetical protein